jgi:hypothetical protein
MSTIKRQPTLTDLLNIFKKTVLDSINSINIGVIQSFNTTDQTAKIQLSIKRVIDVATDGTKILQDRPVLAQVPCIILGGAHNVRVPILQGDIALVFFNDRDIDNWFVANSGLPNTLRMHDISDGIAITGLHNVSNAISDFLNDRISIYWDASNKIEVLSGAINAVTTLMTLTGGLKVTGQIEGGTIKADNGSSGYVYVASAPSGPTTTKITFTNGIRTA